MSVGISQRVKRIHSELVAGRAKTNERLESASLVLVFLPPISVRKPGKKGRGMHLLSPPPIQPILQRMRAPSRAKAEHGEPRRGVGPQ